MFLTEVPQMAALPTESYDGYYSYYNESFLFDSPDDPDIDTHTTQAIVYYLMFAFSLCGNGLVLLIIYLFEKLGTVTNIILLNLVVSSLLFICSLPFWADYLLRSDWVFGNVMCKLVVSFYYLGFNSSVLFLSLLTFDRHLAVVYSIRASRWRNRGYALVSCAGVWIASALACIKPMILIVPFTRMVDNRKFCQEFRDDNHFDFIDAPMLRTVFFYIQLLIFFLFPLMLIAYFYIRIAITVLSSRIVTKFKTVRLIFVIVLLFFSCWTPFNIALLMYEQAPDTEKQSWLDVMNVTRMFANLYFCISPMFYTFVGKKFQNYFRMLLVNRFPRLKSYISLSQMSRTNMSTRSTPNDL